MNETMVHVEPHVLLRSAEDNSVLSFRHRALDTSHLAAMKGVQDGTLVPVGEDVAPTLRTCLGCGCTDKFGCEGGCSWAETLLCSRCDGADLQMRSRDEILADASVAYGLAANKQINEAMTRYSSLQVELLLDIRELLAYQAASQSAGLSAMIRSAIEAAAANPGRIVVPGDMP